MYKESWEEVVGNCDSFQMCIRDRRKKRDELEIASDKKRGDNIIMPFDNSEKRRIFETCYQDNQRRINPLAYWTDSDIWSYSKDVGLEQCGLCLLYTSRCV